MNSLSEFLNETLNVEVVRDRDGLAFIVFAHEDRRHVHALEGKGIVELLGYLYQKTHGNYPDMKDLKLFVQRLRIVAMFEAPIVDVSVRVSGSIERVEIDTNDSSGRALIITPNEISLSQPSAYFRLSQSSQPIIVGEQRAIDSETARRTLAEFRTLFPNLGDDEFKLMIGFSLNVLFPVGPEFVGVVCGPKASGKSVLCDVVQTITDPSSSTRMKLEGGSEPVFLAAKNNRLVVLDNVSSEGFSSRASDLLAQISTGASSIKRKLRTDDVMQTIRVKRPILVNSIDQFVTRSDLASRIIYFKTNAITGDNRADEPMFMDQIKELAPRVFLTLCNALQNALGNYSEVSIQSEHRMVNRIKLVTACEEYLGWESGTFQLLVDQNQLSVIEDVVDANPLAAFIRNYMSDAEELSGTPLGLFELFEEEAPESYRRAKGWPRSHIGLSKMLTRIEGDLELVGIKVLRERTSDERTITLLNTAFESETDTDIETEVDTEAETMTG